MGDSNDKSAKPKVSPAMQTLNSAMKEVKGTASNLFPKNEKTKKAEAEKAANVKKLTADVAAETDKKANAAGNASAASAGQKEVPCPFCGAHVMKNDLTGGKKYWKIPFTNPPLMIPIPPFIASILFPDPQKCSCEGKQTVKDFSDDSARYQQAKQKAEANIDKTIETEAKLGTGGTRTTVIAKSETLYVGLGFNRNDSCEVLPAEYKAYCSPGSFNQDPNKGKMNTFKGYYSAFVQGKQTSLGWPKASGNYSIKCANKYQLIAGAGGITMATKGPMIISGGITTITGPQVTIGSSSGPLTLEGDVVSITGKTITLAPTDANVVVRGTLATSGNATIGGHAHIESLSFCKASCVGTEARSTMEAGNPDTTQTFPAAWGGGYSQGTGITSSVMDILIYMMNVITNLETAVIDLLAPTQLLNLANRMGTLAKIVTTIEPYPTGICLTICGPGLIWNYPHVHGLPSLNHTHATMVPDIDYKDYSTPQALRAKVLNESLSSNAPVVPSNKLQDAINYAMKLPGFVINAAIQAQKLIQWILQAIS